MGGGDGGPGALDVVAKGVETPLYVARSPPLPGTPAAALRAPRCCGPRLDRPTAAAGVAVTAERCAQAAKLDVLDAAKKLVEAGALMVPPETPHAQATEVGRGPLAPSQRGRALPAPALPPPAGC